MSFFGFGGKENPTDVLFSFSLNRLFTSWLCDAAVPEFTPPLCHHRYADDTRHPH